MQAVLDIHTQEVQPTGATTDYASPEQLRSLQIQFERREHEDLLINGASSDMFSVGVVLYEQLTGVLPFQPVEHISRSAPASVPEELKGRWEEYEAMSQAHRLWVSIWPCWLFLTVLCLINNTPMFRVCVTD